MNTPAQTAEEFLRATKEFNRRALDLGLGDVSKLFWYHTIELPRGLVTPGQYDFRASLPCFRFPEDMRRMDVLDVGPATGFFAFEFERRGARVICAEIPSLDALDRFPGQTAQQTLEKIRGMLVPESLGQLSDAVRKYTAEELYRCLLYEPFEFCRKLLSSRVERRFTTVYELPKAAPEIGTFDLVFMGDILLHTINPLEALAAVAPLTRGTLVLSQAMPETKDEQPAMLYGGGEDPVFDHISWWLPNKRCFEQVLRKLGFREVIEVGRHAGVHRPFGYTYERPILHAVK